MAIEPRALTCALFLVLGLAQVGGCGSSRPPPTRSHWEDETPPTTTTTPVVEDAGVDAGPPIDGGSETDAVMAIFARSCTPCHRRSGSAEPMASARSVLTETPEDVRALAARRIGSHGDDLRSLLSLRADGYDLLMGDRRLPMPPRGAAQPSLTPDEARRIAAWLRTP